MKKLFQRPSQNLALLRYDSHNEPPTPLASMRQLGGVTL